MKRKYLEFIFILELLLEPLLIKLYNWMLERKTNNSQSTRVTVDLSSRLK